MSETAVAEGVANRRRPEYETWASMMRRCCNPRQQAYARYGGRGIGVAREWRGPGGFQRFFAAIGPKPTPQHTIDRIDNAKGYEPGNVRWATAAEQQRNRTTNRWLEAHGERLMLVDWAARLGCGHTVILSRLRDGWSVERAVTTPVKHPKNPRGTPKPPRKGRPRGERNHRAKLTSAQAEEILRARFTPELRRRDLAARMGVSESTVKAIRIGRCWAHLRDTTAFKDNVIELAERTAAQLKGAK